jgi:hypothetical protein
MDRRRRFRFTPGSEDLEGRQLLANNLGSLFGTSAYYTNNTNTQLSTIQQRYDRIVHLPYFLQSLDADRKLPTELMGQIQGDLVAIIGRLSPAPSAGLNAFNQQLRGMISHDSVQAQAAGQLNETFQKVLLAADAPPEIAQDLASSLNTLTQITSRTNSFPTTIVANDYAAVLQVALGVGRPLRAPEQPHLYPSDDTGTLGDHATTNDQPRLFGTYDPQTTVRIVDDVGHVLGSSPTDARGRYIVSLDEPLSEGTHILYAQGVDAAGTPSLLSPRYGLKIVPAVPRGPLGRGG